MPKNSKDKDVAEIIPDRCIACQMCIGECPVGAIEMKGGVAHIDPEKCIGCGKCYDICPVGAVVFEKPRKPRPAAPGEPRPAVEHEGVAVFIEVRDGRGADVSWELIGRARAIAARLKTKVIGLLPGSAISPIAEEAITYGCDIVYVVDNPLLQHYFPGSYGRALVQLCRLARPEILLLGATALGRDLAGIVATRLETGLTADCTGLDVDAKERWLLMTRPTFGGNIMATILCRQRHPQMSTVRPRVFRLPEKDASRRGEIRRVDLEPAAEALPKLIDFIPAVAGGIDITQAPVLVVVGRGACDSSNLPMLEELAGLLGGTVACSRPVVETGLLPYARQVGQTGKTVAPKLYIGVGVSGSVQHQAGMQGAAKIVAINTDRHAPLVQIADYSIIGDYVQVVPLLIRAIRSRIKQGSAA
jgi:electron transfer flavoprotein alpha subunit